MKKIVASVLALVMALSLAACGNKNTPNTRAPLPLSAVTPLP